jgi:hypothetical protein
MRASLGASRVILEACLLRKKIAAVPACATKPLLIRYCVGSLVMNWMTYKVKAAIKA